MSRYEAEKKAKEEYGDCRLIYKVTTERFAKEINERNFGKMKEALDAVGVWLDLENDELSISIYPEKYIKTKDRNAGRRKKAAWNKEAKENGEYELYKYSDIVLMMQTMKDQELADKIGMPIATFYRHKKALKESSYYNALDTDRLRDKEYLESLQGNCGF